MNRVLQAPPFRLIPLMIVVHNLFSVNFEAKVYFYSQKPPYPTNYFHLPMNFKFSRFLKQIKKHLSFLDN